MFHIFANSEGGWQLIIFFSVLVVCLTVHAVVTTITEYKTGLTKAKLAKIAEVANINEHVAGVCEKNENS